MNQSVATGAKAKTMLIVVSICALLAIFATIDTSEHYRAWRTARGWTAEQKAIAPAGDADLMHAFILSALVADTAVIALCFASGLLLGVSVATDNPATLRTARGLGWAALGLGLGYSAIMATYRVLVGARVVLKGPVFDYALNLQPPIACAVLGFPLVLILYRVSRSGLRRVA